MGEAAIIVDDLAKSYGAVVALEGIGFEVAPGTVTGLLGPNGSGKTTTVAILATALRPDRGVARVSGKANLALIGRLSRPGRKRALHHATKLAERFGLTDAADLRAAR